VATSTGSSDRGCAVRGTAQIRVEVDVSEGESNEISDGVSIGLPAGDMLCREHLADGVFLLFVDVDKQLRPRCYDVESRHIGTSSFQ